MRLFSHWPLAVVASTVVGAVSLFAVPAAHAQIVTNGSFEAGNFTGVNPNSAPGATQLFTGATNITGWTVVNAELAWLQNGNPYGVVASDGIRNLDLTGYHDASPYGGVSQTIATTTGSVYNLSFDIGTYAGTSSGVTASAGAVSQNFIFTALGGGASYQYGTQSFNFTAGAGASTLITLTGSSTSSGNNLGLDNVKVTLVSGAAGAPEPGTLALLGGSLPLMCGLARRSRCRRRGLCPKQ